jgi:hypothetical protein
MQQKSISSARKPLSQKKRNAIRPLFFDLNAQTPAKNARTKRRKTIFMA